MKTMLLNRLKERSTWIGIFGIASTFGLMQFAPEQKEAIIYLAVALFGGAVAVPDKNP